MDRSLESADDGRRLDRELHRIYLYPGEFLGCSRDRNDFRLQDLLVDGQRACVAAASYNVTRLCDC